MLVVPGGTQWPESTAPHVLVLAPHVIARQVDVLPAKR